MQLASLLEFITWQLPSLGKESYAKEGAAVANSFKTHAYEGVLNTQSLFVHREHKKSEVSIMHSITNMKL